MADIAALVVLHELMDYNDKKKKPQRKNKKRDEKGKQEGILQQHLKRVTNKRLGWIQRNVQNGCGGF